MIAVNELIQQAYQAIGMTGLGEAAGDYAEDNMPVVACEELNRLIANLNNQGYIAMSQKWVDAPDASTIYFRRLVDGEEKPNTINMEPPQKIVSVARKVGNRFILLKGSNVIQQSVRNPYSVAMSWSYNTDTELYTYSADRRLVGILTLDGQPHGTVRVWYNSQLPTYKLDDKIYLSDLYNELLLSGLCYRLACYFELSDQKKADCERDFLAAKTLIKRANVTQRMQECANLGTDWRDGYFNGMNGYGF